MRNRSTSQPTVTDVNYLIPPAHERAGGIDTALMGLGRHLSAVTSSETDIAPNTALVHFHGIWQTQHRHAYQTCLEENIPYVVSPHGMLEPWAWKHKIWKKWPYFQLTERSHLRNAAAVFAASQLEADNLTRFVSPDRVQVLPFGIDKLNLPDRQDARKRLGFNDDERILLYFSRIDRKKGLDLLLDALRGVTSTGWRLVIAGDGDANFAHELKVFADSHQRQLPSITWTGGVWGEERWDYLAGSDLFCLPTRSENFGFAVLEALWAGTPVVTTNTTPWAQHLEVEGIDICNPDPFSLRDTLSSLILGPEFGAQQRSNLRDWCKDTYHWETIAQQYADAYRTLGLHSSTVCLVS
ncbi:MAG: glycosyltransferase involved in cell wall biosynthesis [Verrucomicrobiales bacterium]|jgi:glycosyltransferase involved in cell wall biosynthesis